jgi:hypothetical protein
MRRAFHLPLLLSSSILFMPARPLAAQASGAAAVSVVPRIDTAGVTLGRKRLVLRRHGGVEGDPLDEAEIVVPTVERAPTPELRERLEQAIGLESASGMPVEALSRPFLNGEGAPPHVTFKADRLPGHLLQVWYWIELHGIGRGRYSEAVVLADLRTGGVVAARDAFVADSLGALAARVDRRMQPDLARVARAAAGDGGEPLKARLPDLVTADGSPRRFAVADLERFSVGPEGITFHLPFPPRTFEEGVEFNGSYTLSWTEMRPYLRPGGPLSELAAGR